ncbi:MAG: hypothetical protein M2R45_04897 [Verrucomicrobia subdivision 3 bacterium]|nr:hypothetical protein [Limisphaerales bacterium]MCS1417550.1 hypothetical protein [Limisphaerales bacterium]
MLAMSLDLQAYVSQGRSALITGFCSLVRLDQLRRPFAVLF